LNAKKVQCGDNFKQGSLVIKNLIDSANLSNRGNSTCLRPVVQGAKEGLIKSGNSLKQKGAVLICPLHEGNTELIN
jgi:hypothetical protein